MSRSQFVMAPLFLTLFAGFLLLATPADVSAQWCGENGLIRFSLAPGDSIVSSVHQEPENGVTMVELYAWLTDFVPMAHDGEAFLSVGGFEMTLVVEGAEAFILEKKIPIKNLDMGQTNEVCIVGLDPGLKIRNNQVHLVTWKIMFQGKPEDVVFRLETEPGHSCKTMEGCLKCGSPALYIGVDGSQQLSMFVGAGSAPAYLNPTGEPDFTPVRGTCSFEDVGIFKRR